MIVEYNINKPIIINEYLKSFHLSNSNLFKLISLNAITCNNKIVKNNETVEGKVYINFSFLEDNSSQIGTEIKLNILYEDDNFIAIDKESKILIHSDGNTFDTLLNGIVFYLKEKYDDSFVRPLHRIDFDTKGVVVFSKNILAHSYVNYLIENNLVYKKYLAITKGIIEKDVTLNYSIGKDRHNSKKYCVSRTGKPSITNVHVLKTNKKDNKSLIEVVIKTGRPHQIRLSLKEYGHPILGDTLYDNGIGDFKLLSKEFSFDYLGSKIYINSKKDYSNG